MAIGTYEIANAATYGDVVTGNRTSYFGTAQRITFTTPNVTIVSVFFYQNNGSAGSIKFQIFKESDASVVTNQTINVTSTTGWQEHAVTPVTLESGVQYSIGFYTPSPGVTWAAYDSSGTASNLTGQSTPAGVSSTWWGQHHYTSSAGETTMPVTALNDTLMMKLSVVIDSVPPNAPTGVSVTNSPVPREQMANATWTYSDAAGTPQAKYQIRWRKV